MSENKKFPPQIKFIVGNEAAERYSFYGMRSILVLFMTKYLLLQEQDAVGIYHNFNAFVYLTPLLGAWLSDRLWGKYKTIMRLSMVYCLGHLVLSLFESKTGMYWGLGLIALGAGGIKPCVSAHVGDQFKPHQKELLEKVFSLFYWMINFGAFFTTLITPWTYEHFGPRIAFGIPGILMAVATFVFWMGRKHYVHVPPAGPNPHSFLKVLCNGLKGGFGASFIKAAKAKHPEVEVQGTLSVLKLILLYIWVSMFWALFDQSGSTWILQGEKMNLNFMGTTINPAQLQAINPILVMALIPIFSWGIYPALEKLGLRMTSLKKMVGGMFLGAVSFASIAIIQSMLEKGADLSIAYQFIPYLLITVAEVMISVTGLEFAYTQAPRSMKSTIMSFWLLTTFFGNMLTSYLTYFNAYPTASSGYFWQFAWLMFGVSFVFMFFTRFYVVQNYMESDPAKK